MLARLICALLPLSSCGTQGGQGLAQAGADVIGKGLAGAGREEPERWSARPSRCGIFGDYGLACPALPNCRTLDQAGEITVNACDHEAGRLKPIKLCKGWHGAEQRCAAGEFEPCDRYLGAPCGGYELFVCQRGRDRAVLQCCARPDCEPGTLTRIEAQSPVGTTVAPSIIKTTVR